MTLVEAILLGIVQGVFMFVPVSSTSHLALTQHLLTGLGSDLPPPDDPGLILFDLVVHVGTLVSVVVVMGPSLRRLVDGFGRDLRAALRTRPRRWSDLGLPTRLVLLGGVTVAVTGVIGLVAKPAFERVFAEPALIAVNLVLTGAMLTWTDRAGPGRRGLRQLGIGFAVAIGIAQGLALAPGISRSGTTIAVALAFGLRRRWAAEYSFFVAIPTILAGAAVQAAATAPAGDLSIGVLPMAVGFVTAAAVGTVALALVLRLLYTARFRIFAWYVWGLAAVVLVTRTGSA